MSRPQASGWPGNAILMNRGVLSRAFDSTPRPTCMSGSSRVDTVTRSSWARSAAAALPARDFGDAVVVFAGGNAYTFTDPKADDQGRRPGIQWHHPFAHARPHRRRARQGR